MGVSVVVVYVLHAFKPTFLSIPHMVYSKHVCVCVCENRVKFASLICLSRNQKHLPCNRSLVLKYNHVSIHVNIYFFFFVGSFQICSYNYELEFENVHTERFRKTSGGRGRDNILIVEYERA